jgi:hypothetical protein
MENIKVEGPRSRAADPIPASRPSAIDNLPA